MANIGDKFLGFDMDLFIKHNFDNSMSSLRLLREDKYWPYFEILANYYEDISRAPHNDLVSNHFKMMMKHFLAGCSLNLVKGVSAILAGQFTDSSQQVRRTLESVRYCVFVRENPEDSKLWFNEESEREFEKRYRSWLRSGGTQKVDEEFPNNSSYFSHASNLGPHPGAALFSRQHSIWIEGTNLKFRKNYHDLEASEYGYLTLLDAYFWHVHVHANAIMWWIQKSTFVNHLTNSQLAYWRESYGEIEDANLKMNAFIRERIRALPSKEQGPNFEM